MQSQLSRVDFSYLLHLIEKCREYHSRMFFEEHLEKDPRTFLFAQIAIQDVDDKTLPREEFLVWMQELAEESRRRASLSN